MSRQYGSPSGGGSGWANAPGGGGRGGHDDDPLGRALPSWSFPAQRTPPLYRYGSSASEGSQATTPNGETASLPSATGTSVSSMYNSHNYGGASVSTMSSPPPSTSQLTLHGLQPKAILAGWFGKTYRQLISKNEYHSWHDGGMPHQLKFTAVFVSPISGEVWPSGRYGDASNYVCRRDPRTNADVFWYNKKTFAEHAAAARAYDCFLYRENIGRNATSSRISVEEPYTSPQEAPPLPTLPLSVETKIMELHSRLLGQGNAVGPPTHVPPGAHSVDEVVEDEANRFRDEYRYTRGTQSPGEPFAKRHDDMDTL